MPAPVLFILGGTSMYAGAALAVSSLFTLMAPAPVAWLRSLLGGVFLLAWRRPFGPGRWPSRRDTWRSLWFGLFLLGMNLAFYEAIHALPLGTVVAIEFLGPVAVAALGGKGPLQRIALVCAAAGVVLLAGVSLEGGSLAGLLWALAAGVLWAGYIVLGKRVAGAAGLSGLDGLAVGMCLAVLVTAPFFVWFVRVPDLHTVMLVLILGLTTSAVPYVIDQIVLRRVHASTFSIMQALLPATALLMGVIFLRQVPHLAELGGLALVTLAVVLVSWPGRRGPVRAA
ncbi:EamA family transporter [Micrococcales bacterium 31B]|nr:EamA family transporter [Micrococcales bacterium 31B]